MDSRANTQDELIKRGRIIGLWKSGQPSPTISETVGVGERTGWFWIKRWRCGEALKVSATGRALRLALRGGP